MVIDWSSLPAWQYIAIALCFVWSGFVRSGLGFGGAALTLPFLLLIFDNPVVFLPAIAWQLLVISIATVLTRLENVHWVFLLRLLAVLFVPFTAGLFGLFNFSGFVLSLTVFSVTLLYGVSYVRTSTLNRPKTKINKSLDTLGTIVGGYFSGVALIGAPIIVASSARRLPAHMVRDTFFVLWIVMVIFKLVGFQLADVDLQWKLTLWTFPMTLIGHYLGQKVHDQILKTDRSQFEKFIGIGLILVSCFGISTLLRTHF
ncbi:MAG: sulfite exporter TauE/SafE family protein [Gammaproteobacteria bacterium]|nr:sulfite exporter TauE/SafE family protein [Gammaproteobacteria bacterium]